MGDDKVDSIHEVDGNDDAEVDIDVKVKGNAEGDAEVDAETSGVIPQAMSPTELESIREQDKEENQTNESMQNL